MLRELLPWNFSLIKRMINQLGVFTPGALLCGACLRTAARAGACPHTRCRTVRHRAVTHRIRSV